MKTFVFLQVGDDPYVEMMVDSINRSNPNSRIIQCSDAKTNLVPGVTEIFRLNSDCKNLMKFRLEAFSRLNLIEPAIYLDTDMLVLSEISIDQFICDVDVLLCRRSFGCDQKINTKFKGIDLSEYENKTIDEIYPILACFTVTKSHEFWDYCLLNLNNLNEKFHFWYGDQEAMRNVIASNIFKYKYLPESLVACLPEYISEKMPPLIVHFKGPQRKMLMKNLFETIN